METKDGKRVNALFALKTPLKAFSPIVFVKRKRDTQQASLNLKKQTLFKMAV